MPCFPQRALKMLLAAMGNTWNNNSIASADKRHPCKLVCFCNYWIKWYQMPYDFQAPAENAENLVFGVSNERK